MVFKSFSSAAMLVIPATEEGKRLTPPIKEAPSINGARVYGMRPNCDILYRVPVSGLSPMQIKAEGLPEGAKIDAEGIITGKIATMGNYKVTVTAKNAKGLDTKVIMLSIGDTLALTPPMGWNSWYSFSDAVSQERVLGVAKQMDASGLANHGWSYVNIDDCWQGVRDPKSMAVQPNDKFPDMKALCDAIHALGFKAGIYTGPWISTYAGYLGGSSDTEDGSPDPAALTPEQRRQPTQFFGPSPNMCRLKLDRIGKNWHNDKDAKQWAKWGFDYVKIDWRYNDIPTTERVHKDVINSGRAIILSLSKYQISEISCKKS